MMVVEVSRGLFGNAAIKSVDGELVVTEPEVWLEVVSHEHAMDFSFEISFQRLGGGNR